MGSIIAYDVLRTLEQRPPGIDHFVTIGSPLGLPIVAQHVREEFSTTTVPREVRQGRTWLIQAIRWRWTSLADDYRPTPGGIRVQDDLAHNGYVDRAGKNDQHNKYGDLRLLRSRMLFVGFGC